MAMDCHCEVEVVGVAGGVLVHEGTHAEVDFFGGVGGGEFTVLNWFAICW